VSRKSPSNVAASVQQRLLNKSRKEGEARNRWKSGCAWIAIIKVARKGPKGLDVATYRRAIDEAVDVDGFVDYRDACDYVRGIEEVIDSVEELLKDGHMKLAETEWAKVPVLGTGRDDSQKYGKRFRITHIMETLASLAGDVEALVAIKLRDLSSAYSYLQIAETCKGAGMHDLALEWAERGVKAFPVRTDGRLREFLAREYHRLKRHDEAMVLIWTEFTESPALERYRILKAHADRIGLWNPWRERALEYLRETIAKAKDGRKDDGWGRYVAADHSDFVRIFLWEKDVEAAWREAGAGGCSDGLWMELAGKREKDHPEEVLPILSGTDRAHAESEEQSGVPRGRRAASENPWPYGPARR
jgi:hypothetical protein